MFGPGWTSLVRNRADVMLEQLEERIVLDAYDGSWTDLGGGYWFRYDEMNNDQYWWYSGWMTNDDRMCFDPEDQQWWQSDDAGATWWTVGDAGLGAYADPADTSSFLFDGLLHDVGEDSSGNKIYFQYYELGGAWYSDWSVDSTTNVFAYGYGDGQWYVSTDNWSTWDYLGDAGESSRFLYDGNVHYNAWDYFNYWFDLSAMEGHWDVMPDYDSYRVDELVYDYVSEEWQISYGSGLESFEAVDSSHFYYDNGTYELVQDELWFEFNLSNGESRWTIGDNGLYFNYDYDFGEWYLKSSSFEIEEAQDNPGWIWDIYDGSWYDFSADYSFRIDSDNVLAYFQYNNTAQSHVYDFYLDVNKDQWHEWDGSQYVMFTDPSSDDHTFIYDGNSHYFGMDVDNNQITYTYDGTTRVGHWDIDSTVYEYHYNYDTGQWYESRDDGLTFNSLGDADATSYFVYDGDPHWRSVSGHAYFTYDRVNQTGTWDYDYYGGTNFSMEHDFVAGTWTLNGSPFEAFDSSHYYYDGAWYDMGNDVEYRFDFDAVLTGGSGGEGHWLVSEALDLVYDYAGTTWHVNADGASVEAVVGAGTTIDYVDTIIAGGWFEASDGTWLNYNSAWPEVFWWHDSMSGSEWYSYEIEPGQWWLTTDAGATWSTFGSADESAWWLYDGHSHITGLSDSGHYISYIYDGSRYGYWTFNGHPSKLQFAYDYETGEWWRHDDSNGWLRFVGIGDESWFVFDGHEHTLWDRIDYTYFDDINDSSWQLGNASFSYTYGDNYWSMIHRTFDDYRDDELYPILTSNGYVENLFDGNWHEYDTDKWIKVDHDLGRIYWWAQNGSDINYFYYDTTPYSSMWYQDVAGQWEPFGSMNESAYFMFDGDSHETIGIDGITYQYDGSRYGYWSYYGDVTWAYDYNLGQWWHRDVSAGDWHVASATGVESYFIHDGYEHSHLEDIMNGEVIYEYSYTYHGGYYTVGSGGEVPIWFGFADYQWWWEDGSSGWHKIGPATSSFWLFQYENQVALDAQCYVTVMDSNSNSIFFQDANGDPWHYYLSVWWEWTGSDWDDQFGIHYGRYDGGGSWTFTS